MEETKRGQKKFFGIQWKVVLLLLFVSFFIIAIAVSGILGLRQISLVSDKITQKETPLVESIQEALSSMTVGQLSAEKALDIEDPAQIDELNKLKGTFSDSVRRFNMFMAAITWGSETEAFARSDNGENFRSWNEAGLRGNLTVAEPSQEEAQLAGEISIYYDGFVVNTERAIEARASYLNFIKEKKISASEEAKTSSKDFISKARRFSELTVTDLREMVRRSGETTAESARNLKATEDRARRNAISISLTGFLLSLLISIIFARQFIVAPLQKLSAAAAEFGEGKLETKVSIKTGDEMESLGIAFNSMAESLAKYTAGLEKEVAVRTEELKKKVIELDSSNNLLVKREGELTLVNERLQELDKAKSEFISVAAHQLRTPLSAIKWTLSLLIDENSGNMTPEQRSLLMKGYESNERIISLINEMLVVTRIESGKIQYNFSLIHVEDLIESVLLDFAGQAHVRKIKLAFEKPPVKLPYVNADPEKLRNVIQNLLENSMRYTKDGGAINVSIASSDGSKEDRVKVTVRDNGIGIPVHQQSSIFNKFFRADNAVKQQTDGSGLGLFIAKNIVQKHGGDIWFESAEGTGTTFYFTLPAAKTTA